MKFNDELAKAKQDLLDILPNEHRGRANKLFSLYNKELKKRHKLIAQLTERIRVWN